MDLYSDSDIVESDLRLRNSNRDKVVAIQYFLIGLLGVIFCLGVVSLMK